MINQDFGELVDQQKKHKAQYLGGAESKKNRKDTDGNTNHGIHVGAEGRDNTKK
ncbi:hypothetical protein [Bacillus sp. FJAT-45350]|uniref:hypothetical protein n=1 Tax=Bacillus sp. FJAT-45350 TaxID=2011014 RepID=UPI0015C8E18C|nr:hypothetical protein [Bacillus sp. FJAT-45350]